MDQSMDGLYSPFLNLEVLYVCCSRAFIISLSVFL